jgi:hypothetical protein
MHRGAYVHIYTIKQDGIAFAGHDLFNLVVPVIVGDGFAATCRYMGAPGSRPSPWWLDDVPSWLIAAKWQ